MWTTEGFPHFRRRGTSATKHKPLTTSRERKAKINLAPLAQGAPVFSLTPTWLELGPGHSADMLLEGSCDTPKVEQTFLSYYIQVKLKILEYCAKMYLNNSA